MKSVILVVAVSAAILVFYFFRKTNAPEKVEHEYFSRLWVYKPGAHVRWEAEIDTAGRGIKGEFGMLSETTHREVSSGMPTEQEVEFCKRILAEPDRLFEQCKPVIDEAWRDWVKTEPPPDWESSLDMLLLEGISVPKDGDGNNPWEVFYLCEPVGHNFVIQFESGSPRLESVDG